VTHVPLEESVVRYASPRHVDAGRVLGGAFVPRPNDPTLSVNRPAVFRGGVEAAMVRIRGLSRLKIKPTGRYAEISVKEIVEALFDFQELQALQVLEDALAATLGFPADPSHAYITGLPNDNGPMAELCGDILSKKVLRTHQAIL
jgi:hypothetical protein